MAERHTRRTYGKTTAEANRYRASGFSHKPNAPKDPSDLGETIIIHRSPNLGDLRRRLEAAVEDYYAEGEHRGRKESPAREAVYVLVLECLEAGWGPADIGRRFMVGPGMHTKTGGDWIRKARAFARAAEGETASVVE